MVSGGQNVVNIVASLTHQKNCSFFDKQDMERVLNSFNKKFGVLFRKFGSVDLNVLFRLYYVFCTHFMAVNYVF